MLLTSGSFGRVEVQMEVHVSDMFPYMHYASCTCTVYSNQVCTPDTLHLNCYQLCGMQSWTPDSSHHHTTCMYMYMYSHTVALIFTPEFFGAHIMYPVHPDRGMAVTFLRYMKP